MRSDIRAISRPWAVAAASMLLALIDLGGGARAGARARARARTLTLIAAPVQASLEADGSEGEIVDRIVAILDRGVITLSEVEQALAFMRLASSGSHPRERDALRESAEPAEEGIDGRGRGGGSPPAEVVERLIENRLIEREMRRFSRELVRAELVDRAIEELKARFEDEAAYVSLRDAAGLTEKQLREELTRQLAVSRYLEQRFRSLVSVSQDEVEEYFREELLPDVPDAASVELADVTEEIRAIVAERKFNDRVDAFLERLKSQAKIRRYVW
jgi:hypothetical protein